MAADNLAGVRRRLARTTQSTPSQAARDVVPVYRRVAPKRSGRLAAQIHAQDNEVLSTVRSAAGYPYTGVTRFGHRPAVPDRIDPKRGRALRFTIGGRVVYRASVRRYHPAVDWATRGLPDAERIATDRWGREVNSAIRG